MYILVVVAVVVSCAVRLSMPRPIKDIQLAKDYYWIFGHLLPMIKNIDRHLDYMMDIIEKAKGSTVQLIMPGFDNWLMVSDPKCVKHILKDNFNNYEKGKLQREFFQELLGNGIFNADGKSWRGQRKLTSLMVTMRKMKEIDFFVFKENACKVLDIMYELSDKKKVVDMQALTQSFTMESVFKIAFGKDLKDLEAFNCDNVKQGKFSEAFDKAQSHVHWRYHVPLWVWRFMRTFGLGKEGQFRKYIDIVNEEVNSAIKDRLAAGIQENDHDFLAIIVKNYRKFREEPKPSPVEIRDMIVNFIFAGRDTTAESISWCLYELSKNPCAKERVVRELSEANISRNSSYCDFRKLKYLENAIFETIRLHPPVPVEQKRAIQKDVLPDGSIVLPKSAVFFSPYTFGRDKNIWGLDANEFRPERWSEIDSIDQYSFNAFNGGPRTCLGKRMAIFKSKVFLALLLKYFDFDLEDNEDSPVMYAQSITLLMRNPLMMRPKLRT